MIRRSKRVIDCTEKGQANSLYIEKIDVLKGIAIFLVVLGHGIIFYPVNLHENVICNFVFTWLSSVHMPLFFVVSGYCYSYKNNYKEYIEKKIKRLIIPYFVFNLIDIIPRTLLSNLVNRPRGVGESLTKILLYGGEYWFLYTLFIIFLIYPIFSKYALKNKYIMVLYFIVNILVVVFVKNIPDVLKLSSVVYYMVYFSLGVAIKKYIGKSIFEVKFNKTIAVVITIVSLLLWVILVHTNISSIRIITALVGIITIYFFTESHLIVMIFKRFGKYSLQLYLLNGFLLVISRTIIVSVLGIYNPFLIIMFNVLVDFGLSYLFIKYICEKIKTVKIIMGML